MDVLNILHSVPFDDAVTHMEWHTHLPYASMTLGNNDEIRIPIQQQDLCVIPAMSYLYVEGKLVMEADETKVPAKTKLVNNVFAHLFEECRYELNSVVVDRVRNPGITTTLKGYASFNENDLRTLGNAGWASSAAALASGLGGDVVDKTSGNFNFCIPLSLLFGFAEDYRRIVVNARHELVLLRSASDKNAVLWTKANEADTSEPESVRVKLEKICWRIPYVTLSDRQRIQLLKHLGRGTNVPVEYRSWELHEYPVLPKTTKQTWAVKTASQLEKPRYVIVAFQTGRKNSMDKSAARFDHCKLTNLKLHLNSISYPYDDLKLDFKNNHYALLYDMYARFQESYYEGTTPKPLMTRSEFKDVAPMVIIDCSKQNESLRSAPVDIRLEFEAAEQFPDNTCAYCLIIHDQSFTYDPSTSIVRKLV